MSITIFNLFYQESPGLFLDELFSEFNSRNLKLNNSKFNIQNEKDFNLKNEELYNLLNHKIFKRKIKNNFREIKDLRGLLNKGIFKKIPNPVIFFYNFDIGELTNISQRKYIDFLRAIIKVKKIPKIQGWFSEKEGLFYRQLVKNIKKGIIVEVGSWKGRSLSYIGRLCKLNRNELHCVDWWAGTTDIFNDSLKRRMVKEDPFLTFLKNMNKRGIDLICHKDSSSNASKKFRDSSIDLVFIDASHDYLAVNNDLNHWFKKIKKGGIIAGHDYALPHKGLIRAVDNFVTKHKLILKRGPDKIWYAIK